jgi:hypothetical protein
MWGSVPVLSCMKSVSPLESLAARRDAVRAIGQATRFAASTHLAKVKSVFEDIIRISYQRDYFMVFWYDLSFLCCQKDSAFNL